MNLNSRKAALLTGACMALLIGAPAAQAAGVEAPAQAQQQASKVTGTVLDEQGEPIIGASVVVKGTNKGVVTDINGQFTIDAAPVRFDAGDVADALASDPVTFTR